VVVVPETDQDFTGDGDTRDHVLWTIDERGQIVGRGRFAVDHVQGSRSGGLVWVKEDYHRDLNGNGTLYDQVAFALLPGCRRMIQLDYTKAGGTHSFWIDGDLALFTARTVGSESEVKLLSFR
jgi:hypothetical protein